MNGEANKKNNLKNAGMANIFFLGMVSFFTDLSSEMVYPLIPLYLTAAFGATPALIGVIEGVAESLASLLKVFSGYVTDRFKKKKATAFAGYFASLFYKAALIVAGSWAGILAARVIDRAGKGIRTAPRDVLVSESADKGAMGKAFGLHKALDMSGAALGILITYFVLHGMGDGFDYKRLFLIALVPALLGLAMFLFIKEKKERPPKEREPFWKNIRKVDGQLKLYLLVVFVFTLGNSSNVFILLKAKEAGFDAVSVILLYFVFNITASVLSVPCGKLSDRVGRKNLLVPGYVTFSLCYLGFAFANGRWQMAAVFIVYGVYTAMISGVERAFVAEAAPPELKGTMLGLQSTVAGIALLPASVIAGLMWTVFGAEAPFVFGAALSLAAAGILILFMKNKKIHA
ncbi:MAG: MFS transporter [Defluviitaleaceae bacterium]|nr:MFS transporter [Defluviitaleaceae bacterium]